MLAVSLMLGGLLPLDPSTRAQWPPAGAWRLPVGDAYAIPDERPLEPGPFFVLRGVEWDGDHASHQGADLGCGRAGDPVRAAAGGVVVRVADHGEYGGYGTHLVLAHRMAGGVLAYSVYAHLRLSSVRVRQGQRVQAGQIVARVGATGRVTAPHLHFEVRIADDPEERWEFARVEDPLAFVIERLPVHRGDTTGVDAYLEWGECGALLSTGARGDDALTREMWWRMLAASVRGPVLDPGLDPNALRNALVESGILADDAAGEYGGAPVSWHDVARDLGRARVLGVRCGNSPLRRVPHRKTCRDVIGMPAPSTRIASLAGRDGRPTVAEGVVLIADLGGPRPEAPRPPKRVASPAAAKPKRRLPPVPPPSVAEPAPAAAPADSAPDTTSHRP